MSNSSLKIEASSYKLKVCKDQTGHTLYVYLDEDIPVYYYASITNIYNSKNLIHLEVSANKYIGIYLDKSIYDNFVRIKVVSKGTVKGKKQVEYNTELSIILLVNEYFKGSVHGTLGYLFNDIVNNYIFNTVL